MNRKGKVDETKQKRFKICITFIFLILIVLAGLKVGAVSISLLDLADMLQGDAITAKERIMLYVRIPRVLAAIIAGAGLSVSGTIIQIVLGNPMAGPNIIGVNAGAGFAVVLCSAMIPGAALFLPAAAFIGALVTVLFVYGLARATGASKTTLILAGIAINSLINGATDMIFTFDQDAIINSSTFRIGGLSGINMTILIPAGIAISIAIFIAYLFHNEMEVLSLGDETAKTLGMTVGTYRLLFLVLAAILAGASVSFAGLIGFVGLIVPHIARIIIGTECKYLIPMAALLGSVFLCFCDLLSRVLFAPFELPVGIILSFLGAPFFLYLLIHQRKRGIHD